MAELADAYGSGPYGGNPMKVQVLSPAPLNERAPSNGSFFVMGPSRGLEPAKERASRKRGAFLASWRVRRQAGEAGADPRSGYADVLSPAPLIERAPSNGGFFVMGRFWQICHIDFAR